jgi:capsular polysaccharide biosynthesis protein
VELEAESKAHRTWTPVLQTQQVPEETVAIATFQWRRVPLTRPVIMRLLAIAAVIVIGCGVFAYGISSMGTKQFGSRIEIQYPISAEIASSGFLREDRTLQTQLVAIKSRSVLAPVALKYHMTVDDLSKKVVASILNGSEVLRIEVDDPSQAKANELAAAISLRYLAYANTSADTNAKTEGYWQQTLARLSTARNEAVAAVGNAATGSIQQQQAQAQLDDVNNQIQNAQTQYTAAKIADVQTQRVVPLTTDPYDVGKVAPKPLRAGLAGALAGIMIAAGVVVLLIRRRLKQMPLDQFA